MKGVFGKRLYCVLLDISDYWQRCIFTSESFKVHDIYNSFFGIYVEG